MREFFFDTGVKETEPNSINGVSRGGTMQIPFYCEDVPENAHFKYASDSMEENPSMICREIHNSKLCSKYAYFIVS